MKTVFITGISKGIGKALYELSEKLQYKTFGIGRNDADYVLDLKDVEAIKNFQFPSIDSNETILINNAGMLGEINRVSNKLVNDTKDVYTVNTIAPILLSEKFLKQYKSHQLTIINISSGAARRPIASWANYCASKAALDAFSQVIQIEAQELNLDLKVYSVAPGIVDTAMQNDIRNANASSFSTLNHYIQNKNSLRTPYEVAIKILSLIDERNQHNEVIIRI